MNIDLLTTIFATASVMIVAGAMYKWRRVPTVRLLRAAERRAAIHRSAMAGLAEVIDDARARGDAELLERLSASHDAHRRALLALDPKAPRSATNRVDLRKAV